MATLRVNREKILTVDPRSLLPDTEFMSVDLPGHQNGTAPTSPRMDSRMGRITPSAGTL